MSDHLERCVLLADRHHGLTEGIRSLVGTVFETVVMVADVPSLLQGAEKLRPALAIVDVSLGPGDAAALSRQLHSRCPGLKLLFLTIYDAPSIAESLLAAGAAGIVLKREIASYLLVAIEVVLRGSTYVSPGIAYSPACGSPVVQDTRNEPGLRGPT
jgi:DNA-binding NarL/FixJ family response regulator